jgi:hypothetical protein
MFDNINSVYFSLRGNNKLTSVDFADSVTGTANALLIDLCNLQDTLDISMFTSYTSNSLIWLGSNASLDYVVLPSSFSGSLASIYLYSTNYTGDLDLSVFNAFGSTATIGVHSNANMTGIKFAPSVTGTISAMYLYSSPLDSIDISMFTQYTSTADIRLQTNSSLEYVKVASTASGTIDKFYLFNTSLDSLDISMFSAFVSSADVRIYANSNLNYLNWAGTITGSFRYLTFYQNGTAPNYQFLSPSIFSTPTNVNSSDINVGSNGWTAAQVNQFLVEMATLVSGESAGGDYTGRVITIAGTNAAPDGTSGGYDGDAAVLSLIGKGFTVTTN